jgi:hypothetical protein
VPDAIQNLPFHEIAVALVPPPVVRAVFPLTELVHVIPFGDVATMFSPVVNPPTATHSEPFQATAFADDAKIVFAVDEAVHIIPSAE